MDALLEILSGRGPAARRGYLAVSLALASVAGLVAVLLILSARDGASRKPCEGLQVAFEGVWDARVKVAVQEAFIGSGRSHGARTYSRIMTILDGYTSAWRKARLDACEATFVRKEQTAEQLGLRVACLDKRREQVRALTDSFRKVSDPEVVDNAVHEAFGLPALDHCSDVDALASVGPVPDTVDLSGCGVPLVGRYNPLAVGLRWIYDVTDKATQLPKGRKIVSVDAFEPVGGCKGDVPAYRTRSRTDRGYVDRWQELREVPESDGRRSGLITIRHRDRWSTNKGVVTKEEYYEPGRVRLDETCSRTIAGATYLDRYDELERKPGVLCGEVQRRKVRAFDWQVVQRDAAVELDLDYGVKGCCDGVVGTCGPPANGPLHRCVPRPGGTPNQWRCNFHAMRVTRAAINGGKAVTYWFAAGIGKVREDARGDETEELICFSSGTATE